MLGNPRETIDVSEVTDFSANQQQQAKVETSRKKAVRPVSRPLAGCRKKRVIRKLRRAAPLGTARRDLLRRRDGISENHLGQAILVIGIRVGDVGLGFLEFGLAKFDDGAETEVVAGLREVEGQTGLFA